MISCSCHLSNKKHALTTTHSITAASKHNLRLYTQQSEYNVELIEIVEGSGTSILNDVKQIYKDEFSEVLKEYNEGKRADRQIKDYLKYVSDSKKNDVAAEVILQIGDKEFWGQKTIEEWKAMTPLLKEQLEAFKAAVPEFKVASAVIHFDESSPHMQVVGVPVATGYQRGMKKQVAKTKVFTKERMEQIQGLLHDQAEKLIQEHPEIFGDENLKPKEKGRNNDMSKEFYIRMKQKQYEEISEEITKLEVERDNLIETQNEIINTTDKMVDEAVEKMADTEMKKEFMRYALLDEPRTPIGKIVSTAFKKFKEWWEQERKTRIIDETKESVLEKLRNYNNKRIDKNKEKKQFINKIDMER
ncbi:plasmid recombination protein [Pseudobutyrivibrio xylanivorans]|uniref:Plasmid recombination enzyme n=1 Tax=Pseudobutyrivibrio xylanivorans TaxID=185007 RepID=A0A1G5RQ66_PSEXY|nr:plasmid recombination protein [Pseudobutyrivibrio xylanivorans]SCZ76255.1 Plasmid recombination enzyme [Pseudobutyrivibrio xylanivorans]